MFNKFDTNDHAEDMSDEENPIANVNANSIPQSITPNLDFDLEPIPPVTGSTSICFISIKWQYKLSYRNIHGHYPGLNYDCPSIEDIAKIANQFAVKIFKLSSGRFTISHSIKSVLMSHNYTKPLLTRNSAITLADPTHKFNRYTILFNNYNIRYSSAASNIVSVPGIDGPMEPSEVPLELEKLQRAIYHENLHLAPFNLGHTSVIHSRTRLFNNDIMNPYPANMQADQSNLNPMHLYLLGWLPREKVRVYTGGNVSFTMEHLYAMNTVNHNIKAIYIPTNDGQPLMLAIDSVLVNPHRSKPRDLFFLFKADGPRQSNLPFSCHTKQVLAFSQTASYGGFDFAGEMFNRNEARIDISRPTP